MTQLGKEVQEKMLSLKIGDYLKKDSLEEFLSFLEGICDRKYANDLINEVEKDVQSYAMNFESNLQGMENYSEYEDTDFTTLNHETPEYLKKNADKIFTPWDEKKFAKSLKKYLNCIKTDSKKNDSVTEDQLSHPDSYEEENNSEILENYLEEIAKSNAPNFGVLVNLINQPDKNIGNKIRRSIKKKIESIRGCIKKKKIRQSYLFCLDDEQTEIKIEQELQSVYEKLKKEFVGDWKLLWMNFKPLKSNVN